MVNKKYAPFLLKYSVNEPFSLSSKIININGRLIYWRRPKKYWAWLKKGFYLESVEILWDDVSLTKEPYNKDKGFLQRKLEGGREDVLCPLEELEFEDNAWDQQC